MKLTWEDIRFFIRGVLGIRPHEDDAAALRIAMERRYDDVSRCC